MKVANQSDKILKLILVALLAMLIVPSVGCQGQWFLSTPKGKPVKVVYYFQGHSHLSIRDLQTNPEIVVVQTFDKFKQYSNRKVALWIDQSA